LFDDDNNGRKESVGDGAGGKGASSAESITPNPISFDVVGQTHPWAADCVDTTVASGSGNKRKHAVLAAKRKPSKTSANQVMTQIEIPLYCGPRSPLDLVAVEIIFGRLFVAFWHTSQATETGASTGDGAQPSKRTRAPSMKSMLVPM
jgi:hypothetical protein